MHLLVFKKLQKGKGPQDNGWARQELIQRKLLFKSTQIFLFLTHVQNYYVMYTQLLFHKIEHIDYKTIYH